MVKLTTKQKNYIQKNRKKLSVKKIAQNLSVSPEKVEEYLTEFKPAKAPLYFYLILILIPIAFLLLLEGALRLFDYGKNLDHWLTAEDKYYYLNPDVASRYFYTTGNIPYSAQDFFDIKKSPSTIRIFVVGGSSAAGFPFTPGGSFAKYVKKRLELLYPARKIEVVNTAMSAINSYALRDLIPSIIEKEPDVILFYAGHNEYYGALGVGSMESLGTSRSVVNFMISMNDYKTIQLLRDMIRWISGLFAGDEKRSGTLMARMAKEQLIPFESDVYQAGLNQFKENLNDILKWCKESGVKVITGKLVSNLKDQKPFISDTDNKFPAAEKVYREARSHYESGKYHIADSLFRFAKDLDALRFRAPEKVNEIILELCGQYDFPVAEIVKEFVNQSPGGIVGDELMTDHLHPTIEGYRLMGRAFVNALLDNEFLPSSQITGHSPIQQDSIAAENFSFSPLDSVLGRYRIIALKTDWPYVEKPLTAQQTLKIMNPRNYRDSLALFVLDDKKTWEKAHREAAAWHLQRNEIRYFMKEMDPVIDAYPTFPDYLEYTAEELMRRQYYNEAYDYLLRLHKSQPGYFSNKWLGILNLSKENVDAAIAFLEASVKFNGTDPQVFYNLSGAYSKKGDFGKAYEAVNRCLRIDPNFRGAQVLQNDLQRILSNR